MQQHNLGLAAIDLDAVAHRIRQMLSDLGISGTTFCSETGIPYSTFRTYTSGARAPNAEFFAAAFRAYGVMPSWLLTGDGLMFNSGRGEPAKEAVAVPWLKEPGDVDDVVQGLSMSRIWLTANGISSAKLAVVRVRGDSMRPTLSEGDAVLIDQADTASRSGVAFVFRQGDELQVKYCQVLPGGRLRLRSENPNFEPYDVDMEATPNVKIVGRVVASLRKW